MLEVFMFLGAICAAAYATVIFQERIAKRMARPRKTPAVRLISRSDGMAEDWWAQYDTPTCWRMGIRPDAKKGSSPRRKRTKLVGYEVLI